MTYFAATSELLNHIRSRQHFLLTSHSRPDGDAVGSLLAMAMLLDQLGKTCEVVVADPVPFIYRNLPQVDRIRVAPRIEGSYDAVILLECDSVERSGIHGTEGMFLINIDHHSSGREFGNCNWIDQDACAVAAMVYHLAVTADVTITPEMATCLYAAILTDTGSFTYPGTNADTFALARELVLAGADAAWIAREVYFTNPAPRIRILGSALSNLHLEGKIAWAWITLQDMIESAAEEEDCEGVVNYLISIAGIDCAVFLRELPRPFVTGTPQFRLSIRSKGGINVALVAEHFGGGGHVNASGCTISGSLETAIDLTIKRLRAELC
ncbi:DHH family phosphoesterase [Terriglobus tenax]|uniref:DHH family phosphoesterase n=1 Tax=Terriglobus tenax TaxID=1111115 RepID=UPI0021E0D328|nr:bifunctional oligoribonuclease/PAP phosphatase NrnA [Terriglobus tenax]